MMKNNPVTLTATEKARALIEEIAQRKGTFTDVFRQEAEREAEYGRKGMLQAMACGEEIREDFSKLLKM
jgi:general stress protein YciG